MAVAGQLYFTKSCTSIYRLTLTIFSSYLDESESGAGKTVEGIEGAPCDSAHN
jgi:hypothetical protein